MVDEDIDPLDYGLQVSDHSAARYTDTKRSDQPLASLRFIFWCSSSTNPIFQ